MPPPTTRRQQVCCSSSRARTLARRFPGTECSPGRHRVGAYLRGGGSELVSERAALSQVVQPGIWSGSDREPPGHVSHPHHPVNPLAIQHSIAGGHGVPRQLHPSASATALSVRGRAHDRSSADERQDPKALGPFGRLRRTAFARPSARSAVRERPSSVPPSEPTRTTRFPGTKRTTPLTRWPYRRRSPELIV